MARRTDTTAIDPVLSAARAAARDEVMAAARKFELAATWAAMHPAPVEDPVVTPEGAVDMYGDQPVTLAGEGAPGMSEFAIAELAAALGLSTRAGRDLIGAALECKHRLPKIWDQVMAVNLTANYRLIRSMDPLLRRSEAGRAIFLSSGVASNPRAFWAAYAVSKAGLEAMARIYADETAHTPVRVAVVNPGPMRTRMRAQAFPGEDPNTLPEPAEIVPLILELARPDAEPPSEMVHFKTWRETRTA